mmetsp:Transcript_4949/g.15001  ORF Transcript_4949/g.15001 Transcript_4949/m.15001 type:complete len:215 (-) Transcript_4949:241-885(-)
MPNGPLPARRVRPRLLDGLPVQGVPEKIQRRPLRGAGGRRSSRGGGDDRTGRSAGTRALAVHRLWGPLEAPLDAAPLRDELCGLAGMVLVHLFRSRLFRRRCYGRRPTRRAGDAATRQVRQGADDLLGESGASCGSHALVFRSRTALGEEIRSEADDGCLLHRTRHPFGRRQPAPTGGRGPFFHPLRAHRNPLEHDDVAAVHGGLPAELGAREG